MNMIVAHAGEEIMDTVQNDERELADAILEGAKRRPQAFGSYFTWEGGSCALGAAFEGIHHLPEVIGPLHPRLERLFHCLEDIIRACPVGCKKKLPLASLIVHLNDDHLWTREQIAEWLKQEDPSERVRTHR
jgi:hypothetical protein